MPWPQRSHGFLPVDRLADDVGMAGVLGCFRRNVQEHLTGRAPPARLEPWRRWERPGGAEVWQCPQEVIGAPGHLVVGLQQSGQGLTPEHLEFRTASCPFGLAPL